MNGHGVWTFALLALLLAACGGGSAADGDGPSAAPSAEAVPETTAVPGAASASESPSPAPMPTIRPVEEVDLDAVPEVDASRHSVPLEQIIFDTFRPVSRAVPLTEADAELIRSLRDAIPPLYEPRFATAAETDEWLFDDDVVLGYAAGGEAYAYPVKILNFHEMASHRVAGRDILASYCPLCRSGIVYDRLVPGTDAPLLLGNTSALYESDMVMFDHQTGSYWNQVTGEAIAGALTGRRLPILPSQMTTWGAWKALYPETLALSEKTGFERNYRNDPFAGYGERLNGGAPFAFPVSEAGRDPRLDPGEVVLGLELNGARRAYPLERLGDAVVHDGLGGTDVVIFSRSDGPGGAAYLRQLDGRRLTFVLEEDGIRDRETGSRWDLAGRAVEGELAGAHLEAAPARSTYWFSLVANYPDVDVYRPGE